jgi:hypothetical protein
VNVSIVRVGAISVGVLSASTWIGSLVCLAAVSQVARRELSGASRIALFRGVGRLYRTIGTVSLLTSIAIGSALAWPLARNVTNVRMMFVLSGVLLGVTVAGMAQARRMTLARRRLLAQPGDGALAREVRRGGVVAGALRGAIALITVTIVVLGAAAVA